MTLETFNTVKNHIIYHPTSVELSDNTATYRGMFEGNKVTIRFEDVGYYCYLTMNEETYLSSKGVSGKPVLVEN